ncbi:SLAM family member 5 isoform X2 [Brachionichthys hirsutus]|uniref:SLAM family member 5 isoform X2 n=1 Tax=Brachionichthys hirsutus TaxID=412623 RepID=UPI0036053475
MKLQIVLIALLRVVPVGSTGEVSAYVGDSVTLSSGADASWNLSRVDWSIFSNSTWIATLRKGKEITERFYLYRGRLRLNRTSGDLTIRDLNMDDAMEYHADVISTEGMDRVNKIRLLVRRHLRKPSIRTVISSWPDHGGCSVLLSCSSSDEGVALTWQVEPAGVPVLNASGHGGGGGGAVALSWIPSGARDRVNVTCTSRRNLDEASSVAPLRCDDDDPPSVPPPLRPLPPPPPSPQPINRYYAAFFMGGVLGGFLAVILVHIFRGKTLRKTPPETKP